MTFPNIRRVAPVIATAAAAIAPAVVSLTPAPAAETPNWGACQERYGQFAIRVKSSIDPSGGGYVFANGRTKRHTNGPFSVQCSHVDHDIATFAGHFVGSSKLYKGGYLCFDSGNIWSGTNGGNPGWQWASQDYVYAHCGAGTYVNGVEASYKDNPNDPFSTRLTTYPLYNSPSAYVS